MTIAVCRVLVVIEFTVKLFIMFCFCFVSFGLVHIWIISIRQRHHDGGGGVSVSFVCACVCGNGSCLCTHTSLRLITKSTPPCTMQSHHIESHDVTQSCQAKTAQVIRIIQIATAYMSDRVTCCESRVFDIHFSFSEIKFNE